MDALYIGAMILLGIITWMLMKLCEYLGDR
jgi:hypothetical protein